MTRQARLVCAVLTAGLLLCALAATAQGAARWNVKTTWADTNLEPGGIGQFHIDVQNIGDSDSVGGITLTNELPDGVVATGFPANQFHNSLWSCSGTSTVECAYNPVVPVFHRDPDNANHAGYVTNQFVHDVSFPVSVDAGASGIGANTTTVTGGGAAEPGVDIDQIRFSPTNAPFGPIEDTFKAELYDDQFPDGAPVRQAASHPFELRVDFDFTKEMREAQVDGIPVEFTSPVDNPRTTEVTLPVGVIGNPEATPKCDPQDFLNGEPWAPDFIVPTITTDCPPETQVGVLNIHATHGVHNGFGPGGVSRVAVYNVEPPDGYPADFAFSIGGFYAGHIYPVLDAGDDYAIKAVVPNISTIERIENAEFTMWGVPGDPAHDDLRANPDGGADNESFGASSEAPIRPLLTLPAGCGSHGRAKFSADSWQRPEEFIPEVSAAGADLDVTGCEDERIRFKPNVALQPTDRHAGAPTGLQVDLNVPQRNDVVPDADLLYEQSGDLRAIATPPMRKAVVTMPEGMTISTSAAQGLGSCTPEQIGLGTDSPVTCPLNSQYGTLTLHTPILPPDEPMQGKIYIAKQNDNPYGDFLALYFVVQDKKRGLLVKLPGRIALDPVTGQITTTLDDLPQFPISKTTLAFKGGVRSALVNPSTCGVKTIKAEFTPWSDPSEVVTDSSSYEITERPDGSPCVNALGDRPFRPELTAGTANPSAGAYSPFAFRLTRSDDDQEFSQLGVDLPPGLLAKVAGVAKCSDAAIVAAAAPTRTGTEEAANPSCPASSRLGSSDVGSGVGVPLTYLPGKVYLAGPYQGAPLSMVVITPLLAGPYDLGVIAVRSAFRVDPETAQVSVFTDPFPLIFEGIPVRIRDVRIKIDRPETTINPTSCDPMQVAAHVTGTGGNVATTDDDTRMDLTDRFQAANCQSLGFKPQIAFRLKGETRRGGNPAFFTRLKARSGDANIARASVTLPPSEFLDNAHIGSPCTRVQYRAGQCPASSRIGFAKATSPLIDAPLQGPVYLRTNPEHELPDLVASLDGEFHVDLAGTIDSVKANPNSEISRIRNRFTLVPDVPVTEFTLSLQGGDKGLLQNSRNLCQRPARGTVKFTAHNGKATTLRPSMKASCGKTRSRGSK